MLRTSAEPGSFGGWLKKYDSATLAYLMEDMREGCAYDSPPMRRWGCWNYGKEDAPEAVKALEAIVSSSKLVLDIHNCAFTSIS